MVDYMTAGGRLFVSSQDLLYYQAGTALSGDYLGVLGYQDDVSPTVAYGVNGALAAAGPLQLDYPFRNFSDGIIPGDPERVELVGDSGWPLAVTTDGTAGAGENWKSVFFAFPFASLPGDYQANVMKATVGWLGWLGNSEFEAKPSIIAGSGAVVTFTATLRNDGPESATAFFGNPLPPGLGLITDTLSGGGIVGGQVEWSGILPAGDEHRVEFAGLVTRPLTSTAVISYTEHGIAFHRQVVIRSDVPDLTASRIESDPPVALSIPDRPVSYSLQVGNGGLADARDVVVDWRLPFGAMVLSDTIQVDAGTVSLDARTVRWQGDVLIGETITVSVAILPPAVLQTAWLSSAAFVSDNVGLPLVLTHFLEVRPLQVYLPILMR